MAGARKKSGGRKRPTGGRVTKPANSVRSVPRPAEPSAALGQPGRRPSSSGLLLLIALMWFTVGVVVMTSVSASWKFVPGIVSVGIGLLFLRGAAATVARRAERPR